MAGNYFYFSKPVNIEELIAKLKPYGIGAVPVDYVPGMREYIILHYGTKPGWQSWNYAFARDDQHSPEQEELYLYPDYKDESKVMSFNDITDNQGQLIDDVWVPKPPTTIMNAIREVVGELLDQTELERRAQGNPDDAYLQYLARGGDEEDHDRWLKKCQEMHPDLFDDGLPFVDLGKWMEKREQMAKEGE
jgi:hypothetical protein